MIKSMKRKALGVAAAFSAGMLLSTTEASANNFSSIASNITASMTQLPSLLAGVAYLFGILLGVLGILKIKDHVENPGQTPLKDGAIRLAAGGGLFALPIIYESMLNTVGNAGAGASVATVAPVVFN
ncbi:MAG: hypothetical protein KKA05_01470 [Alphaproteobacteria bacterium]|nr:hypothetical protein [Alphaproteobacteria bacterium]